MKKKQKIRFDRILLVFLSGYFLFYSITSIFSQKVRNIEVKGNNLLKEQQIIEIAKVDDYPPFFQTFTSTIEKRLRENIFVKEVKVNKEWLFKIRITVTERKPHFYNLITGVTYLEGGKVVQGKYSNTTMINFVPEENFNRFIKELDKVDYEVLKRVSEIEYRPSSVDQDRFLLAMSDGNYVYINTDKLTRINEYLTIISNFDYAKGILHLDAGTYFEVFK
jgi:cell division septal protein FtsQ